MKLVKVIHFSDSLQCNTEINSKMDKLVANLPKEQKIPGEQLQNLMDKCKDEVTRELFNWISVNFINLIDDLLKELWNEIRNGNGEKEQSPGYHDPMYEKIKASMENERSPTAAPIYRDTEDKAPLDNLLQSLAKFAEYYKVELPITLFIKGAVVSGMLIGNTAFSEKFEKQIRCLTSNTLEGTERMKLLADGLKKAHEETIRQLEMLSPEERDAAISGTRYIYLKDAEIVSSKGPNIPLGSEGLLRIRTNSIDSFSLGAIRSIQR